MKKYIVVVFILIISISMSACGAGSCGAEKINTQEEIASPAAELPEKPTAEPLQPTLPGGVAVDTDEMIDEIENSEVANTTPLPDTTEIRETDSNEESQGVDLNIASPNGSTEYEKYLAMSGEEQQAFFESFGDPAAFFKWLNAARDEYNALYPAVEIGNGEINLNDYIVSGN